MFEETADDIYFQNVGIIILEVIRIVEDTGVLIETPAHINMKGVGEFDQLMAEGFCPEDSDIVSVLCEMVADEQLGLENVPFIFRCSQIVKNEGIVVFKEYVENVIKKLKG